MTRLAFFTLISFITLGLNAQWSVFAIPCSTVGGQVHTGIGSVYCDKSNTIFVGNVSNTSTIKVMKWNGIKWDVQGQGDLNFPLYVGEQYLCGDLNGNLYTSANYNSSTYVTKFDGITWVKLGNFNPSGIGIGILSLYVDATGNLYAAGSFTNANGNYYVSKWDGNNWSELGGFNTLKANNFINSITGDMNGNIYVGGAFTNTNGSSYIAKWDGSNWSELGGINSLKANNSIYSIAADNSGNVYAGGIFTNANGNMYIAKYNGQVWNETALLGTPSAKLMINTIRCDKKGNTYVACSNTYQQGVFNVFKLVNNSLIAMPGNNPCQGTINASSSIREYYNVFSIDLDTAGNIYAVGGLGNANCNPVVMRYSAPWLVGLSKYNVDNVKFAVYPNPAKEEINFTASGTTNQKFNLIVSNSLGQVLIEKSNTDLAEALDVSHLTQGIYFIQIQNKDFKQSFKVVKE